MRQIVLFLLFFVCTLELFSQTQEKEVSVKLPYEILINNNEKLIIRENGLIEFGNNVFVYNKDGLEYPDLEVSILFYGKNNMFGVNIIENRSDCSFASYTFIFNIETQKVIPYEEYRGFIFWHFFSIGNSFIITYDEIAYAFNDVTGELLWSQTYRQKSGSSIVNNKEYFLIDDIDGNEYKIYGDGRKIKLDFGIDTLNNGEKAENNNASIQNKILTQSDSKNRYGLFFLIISITILAILIIKKIDI